MAALLHPDQTVNLYATYSNINIRPDREAVLAELRRVARDEFQGRVTRNMVTSLYVADVELYRPHAPPDRGFGTGSVES